MSIRIRILIDAFMILIAIIAPWWLVALLALGLLWLFEYVEIIFLGAILDALYGRVMFVLLAYALFIASLYIKPRLTFYRRF